MLRDMAIVAAALAVIQVGYSGAEAAPVAESKPHHAHHGGVVAPHGGVVALRSPAAQIRRHIVSKAATTPLRIARPESRPQFPAPVTDLSAGAPISLSYQVPPAASDSAPETADASQLPVAPGPAVVLSEQQNEVSQIADARGDRNFLMVDKAHGKIILFENGLPIMAGPALTGESRADHLPKSELTEKFDDLNAPKTKITPAGRFTVQRGFDKDVGGELFDVHEIRGKDWGIAIHQVYLGIPSEHRDVRIMSPRDEVKHITFGCINVTRDAIRFLLHELPEKGPTPLYILPEDASQTTAYFTARTS